MLVVYVMVKTRNPSKLVLTAQCYFSKPLSVKTDYDYLVKTKNN